MEYIYKKLLLFYYNIWIAQIQQQKQIMKIYYQN